MHRELDSINKKIEFIAGVLYEWSAKMKVDPDFIDELSDIADGYEPRGTD